MFECAHLCQFYYICNKLCFVDLTSVVVRNKVINGKNNFVCEMENFLFIATDNRIFYNQHSKTSDSSGRVLIIWTLEKEINNIVTPIN